MVAMASLCFAMMTAAPIRGATIDEKIAAMLPTPDEERWLQIPWRTSLMKARAESQREGKPIFVWLMNGHPLGLT